MKGGARVLRKALFSPRGRPGSCLAAEELQPVDPLTPGGTVRMWIDTFVEILGNKAGGRLFCYMNITRVSEDKAVAFSMMLQKKFLWFLYFKKKKKSKLPLDECGQIFNLAVTLNRRIQFKMM